MSNMKNLLEDKQSLKEKLLCGVGNYLAKMAGGPDCRIGAIYEPTIPIEIIMETAEVAE